jgi:hypothetical protein
MTGKSEALVSVKPDPTKSHVASHFRACYQSLPKLQDTCMIHRDPALTEKDEKPGRPPFDR